MAPVPDPAGPETPPPAFRRPAGVAWTGRRVAPTDARWLAKRREEQFTIAASGGVQEIVRAVAATYGWGSGTQWNALSTLIQKESSWNPNAQNPTSTAYGLFQFLNSTWASVGATKTSDPRLQAVAGLKYI